MDTKDIITLVSQLGVGGAVLIVIIKMIVPSIDKVTAALEKVVAAVAAQGSRIARIEGAIDHRAPSEPSAPPMAAGTRDHPPIAIVRDGDS